MAVSQIQQFANLIAAGRPINNPQIFPMAIAALDVQWIEWQVPPGARGNVGFWIGSKGQPIIPYTVGAPQWIVTDGQFTHWDLDDMPDSGDWEMRGYNLGVLAHTVYVRFGLALPLPEQPAGVGFPPLTVLNS